MAPLMNKPEAQNLALLDVDYTRPSQLDERQKAQNKDARAKRRERINYVLALHNIVSIPDQGKHMWTLAIGIEMEAFAVANIPGWKLHYDPNRPLDAAKVTRYSKSHKTAAAAGHQERDRGANKETKPGGVKRRRSASGTDRHGRDVEAADNGGNEADVEDLDVPRVLDEESDAESVEDADEDELRIIAAKKAQIAAAREEQVKQISASKTNMVKAAKDENVSGVSNLSRPAKKQKVRKGWRTWDPALDTESADDDLPFPGYFTSKAGLKDVPAHPNDTVYALVPKYKRKNTIRNDIRRNMGDVYYENDLEEIPNHI